MLRSKARVAVIGASIGIVLCAAPASAGTFSSPTGNSNKPFQVPADNKGNPVSFTVAGTGWQPHTQVWIEQCDGVPPTSPTWNPNTDCDPATSPAGAVADAKGNVSFPVTNHNWAFPVFRGGSPQSMFNCLSPHERDLGNHLTSYRNCQVRMSSNDSAVTTDQTFLPIVLPDRIDGSDTAAPTTTQAPTSSSSPLNAATSHSKGSSSGAAWWLAGAAAILLSGGAVIVGRHRWSRRTR
jgi:hypothetical protein